MKTWGFPPSYSDAVTLDAPFTNDGLTLLGAYIFVGTGGDIVWENAQGQAQWFPGAVTGKWYFLGAAKILSAATVNGNPRSTTAGGLVWFAVNQKYNTP